jgi:hypothetical protein
MFAASLGCSSPSGSPFALPSLDAGTDGAASSNQTTAEKVCSCLPVPPDPWRGPFAIFEATGSPPAPFPDCASDYPVMALRAFNNPVVTPARCSCACGGATNSCAPPKMELYLDNLCSIPCPVPDVTLGAACSSFEAPCGTDAVYVYVDPTDGWFSGCSAPKATVDVDRTPWTSSAELCAVSPASGACATGDVCVPPTGDSFEPGTYCVERDGLHGCPFRGYTVPHAAYYATVTDTRGCTACTCNPPGVYCEVELSTSNGTACESVSPFPFSTGCIPATGGLFDNGAPVDGAECTPSGGAPTGDFTLTDPMTICCTR